MEQPVIVSQLNITVQVPDHYGNLQDGRIIWLRKIAGSFCEASIYIPSQTGYVNYLVIVEDSGDIKLICNSNAYTDVEFTKMKLARNLGFNLHDSIMEQRIKENYIADICMECE